MGHETFKIGVTSEFFDSGAQIWDASILEEIRAMPGVILSSLPAGSTKVRAQDLAEYDILVVRKSGVPTDAFAEPETIRTRLIARFGVGYDHIDIANCRRHGIAVTITPGGIRRPVASSIVALVLALAHRLKEKDLLIRADRWGDGRNMMGVGLEGRVLASVGFGNIAQEAFRLLRPFGMRFMATDPFANGEAANGLGVELVDFETLLGEADFLTINCPLTPKTRHIIDAYALGLVKATTFLINTARGPLVDQAALCSALRDGRLAGAGLDVFETEPTDGSNPLFTFDNVIAAPHSMCWTDECARLTSTGVLEAIRSFIRQTPLPDAVVPRPAVQEA